MTDKPPYLLSDEDEPLDADQDHDPYADDVTVELDFDMEIQSRNDRIADFWDTLVPEEEEEEDLIDEADWFLKQESDIDNERW